MAEVKLRFNLDAEEVELVVDGQVALSSGADVFKNWAEAYNQKNAPVVRDEPVSIEEPVKQEPVKVDEPVSVELPESETTTVEAEEKD